jgi:hypothetical protein
MHATHPPFLLYHYNLEWLTMRICTYYALSYGPTGGQIGREGIDAPANPSPDGHYPL